MTPDHDPSLTAEAAEAFLKAIQADPDRVSPETRILAYRDLGRHVGAFIIGLTDTGLPLPAALNQAAVLLSCLLNDDDDV